MNYRWVFDSIELALWELDLSRLKAWAAEREFPRRGRSSAAPQSTGPSGLGAPQGAEIFDAQRPTGAFGPGLRQTLSDQPALAHEALQQVRILDVNPRALRLFGAQSKGELLGSPDRLFVHDSGLEFVEKFIVPPANVRRWDTETTLQTLQGKWLDVTLTVAFPEHAAARDRALVSIYDNSRQRHAERSLRLLAETGKALAASPGYAERLQTLADIVVPLLADWCVVNVVEPGGVETRHGASLLMAVAHVEPGKIPRLRELAQHLPLDGSETAITSQVLRTGKSEIWPALARRPRFLAALQESRPPGAPPGLSVLEAPKPRMVAGTGEPHPADEPEGPASSPHHKNLGSLGNDPRHWAVLRELGCESLMVLPLSARGRILGTLTLARADAARLYGEAELALAEELARRAALAIDNARLHQAEGQARRTAEALKARLEEQVAQRTQQLLKAKAVLEREVADRQQTESKLRASREQLRNLSAHLQTVREAERSRVAREILDGFGQTMSALKMEVAWLRRNLGSAQGELLQQKADSALGMIDTTIRTVRRIAVDLRPSILDDLGLAAALEWQTNEFERRTGIRCRFVPSAAEVRLDPETATSVFRIYEEILSNVARHALASRIVVTLQLIAGQLILAVRDNGRSITAEEIASPRSLGLIGMRELAQSRNGVLEVVGQQGKGTTVTLRIPLEGNVT